MDFIWIKLKCIILVKLNWSFDQFNDFCTKIAPLAVQRMLLEQVLQHQFWIEKPHLLFKFQECFKKLPTLNLKLDFHKSSDIKVWPLDFIMFILGPRTKACGFLSDTFFLTTVMYVASSAVVCTIYLCGGHVHTCWRTFFSIVFYIERLI